MKGEADLAIAAISITPARQKEHLFSRPYVDSRLVAVTRGGAPADLSGRCAVHGSHRLFVGVLEKTPCRLVRVESHAAAFDAVRAGDAEFTVQDRSATLPPGLGATEQVLMEDRVGVAIARGGGALKEAVDRAIADLEAEGVLSALRRRHGIEADPGAD